MAGPPTTALFLQINVSLSLSLVGGRVKAGSSAVAARSAASAERCRQPGRQPSTFAEMQQSSQRVWSRQHVGDRVCQ